MNDADRDSDDDDCVPGSVQSLVGSLCEPSVSEPMPQRKARTGAGVRALIDARRAARASAPAVRAPEAPKGTAPSVMVATLPSGNDAIQKAVAAVPFLGSGGEACKGPFPSLTVEQYVSLRAALLISPGESDQVLRRYGVPTPASYRALHAHWQEEIARNPELRARVGAVIGTVERWLWGEGMWE